MPYQFDDGSPTTSAEKKDAPAPTDAPAAEPAPAKRFSLIPSGPKKSGDQGAPADWSWLREWADLFVLAPICLVGFLTNSYWIHRLDPTAQVMSVENLTVLNWNLLILFGSSGVIFILWKIWGYGSIFSPKWEDGLTPYERMKVRLAMVAGIAAYTAFVLTRNL